MGNLNLFPIDPQWARILTISKSDQDDFDNLPPGLQPARGHRIVSSKAGFTTVVAVDFGPDGLLYVLELSDGRGCSDSRIWEGGPSVAFGSNRGRRHESICAGRHDLWT